LFSEEGRLQLLQESDTQVRSTLFEQGHFIYDVISRDIECSQAYNGNSKLATNNSHLTLKNTATTTQFTVLNRYDETLDTKTFRLGIWGGQKFDYLPGQYITLSVVVDGKPYKRSYSIASAPSRPRIIEITVKRDPKGGKVSNWLNDHLKVGDTLTAKGSYGKFTCAAIVPSKILLLAAGSGVVPIMSMLRWLTDTEAQVEVSVLLAFRTSHDIIYRDELNLLAARHRNLTLLITLTKEPSDITQWLGLVGRINETMIANCVLDLPERTVYLCGPDAFMADCKAYLENLGCV
jgi:ferredoxin-NADP reductase